MMKQILLIIVLASSIISLQAQVVNIEKKRISEDNNGFSGQIDLSVGFTKTESELLQGKNNIRLQYKHNKHKILLFNYISLIKVDDKKLINDGFQHIRYNYKLEDQPLTLEVFTQHQYNTVKALKRRFLAGAGPRIHVVDNDTVSFHFAPLVMYENETLTDDSTFTEAIRLSLYLAFNWHVTSTLSFNHITYYQPQINDFDDYRISSESNFKFLITEKLAFKLAFNYTFDSRPPVGIKQTFYSITNAISYSF